LGEYLPIFYDITCLKTVISILAAVLTSYSFVPVFEIVALKRIFGRDRGGKVTGGRGVS
jgi:hypothetical protein